MMNIIGNALKYTSEGGVEISLHIEHNDGDKERTSGDPPKNIIVFTVKDSGKGMSNAFLKNHLFMPFSQEDPMSDGVGLGMSIVKGLVAVLAGEMKVESHLGGGTTITVSISMRAAEKQATLERNIAVLRKRVLKVAAWPPTVERMLRAYLEGWFGCMVVPWVEADVAFIAEDEVPLRRDDRHKIVAVGRRRTNSGQTGSSIEYISEPFGPGKVSKALLKCIKSGEETEITDNSAGSSSEATQKKAGLTIRNDLASQKSDATNAMTKLASSPNKGTGRVVDAWSINTSIGNETPTDGQCARDTPPAILLVEDNQINLRLLQTHMKKKGVYQDIQTAENGLFAVQAVERREAGFSVIVMDLSMPEMDGFEATRLIRELEQKRNQTPAMIIALTGLASEVDRDRAYECGVDEFTTKPLKFQELDSFLVDLKGHLKR
jgi:CheY-like chemotaxis protein